MLVQKSELRDGDRYHTQRILHCTRGSTIACGRPHRMRMLCKAGLALRESRPHKHAVEAQAYCPTTTRPRIQRENNSSATLSDLLPDKTPTAFRPWMAHSMLSYHPAWSRSKMVAADIQGNACS